MSDARNKMSDDLFDSLCFLNANFRDMWEF